MKTCITTPWLPTGGLATNTLLRLLVVFACCWLVTPASAQQWRYWNSTNSPNWSNPNNWLPVGVPQNGESVYFPDNGLLVETSNNDLPNLTVGYLTFNHDHTLLGNAISISNGISCGSGDATVTLHVQCPVILASDAYCQSVWANGLIFNENHFYLEGPVNLNGHDLELRAMYLDANLNNQRGNIYVSGPISGTGNVEAVVEELATIAFTGSSANTFSGALTVRTATGTSVLFNKQSVPVVNDQLFLRNAAVVRYGNNHQIGDNATVSLVGGARLLLQGYSDTIGNLVMTNFHADATPCLVDTFSGFGDFAGSLTVNDGIVSWVENASIVPTIRGILNLPGGNHNFFVSAANYDGLNLEAQVTGAGGFTKFGNAALLVKGTNTFGGTVYASGGIIDVHNPNGFGSPAGGVVLNGGSVTLRSLTIASESLTAQGQQLINSDTTGSLLFSVGTATWTGAIQLDTNLVVAGNSMILSGPINGAGGLDFRTFGTAQLSGGSANTYSGKTLVRCPLLILNKPFGVNAFAGPLVVGNTFGDTVEVHWLNSYQNPNVPLTLFPTALLNINGQFENFGPVTFNGGTVQTVGGFFAVYGNITVNPVSTTAAIHGNLSFGVTPGYFIVSNGVADPDLWVNAVTYGGDLRKQGAGTLMFTAANQYTGNMLVEDGILHADNPEAFGSTAGNTAVGSSGTIRLGAIDGMTEEIRLNGTGFQGTNGALQIAGSSTLNGNVVLNGPSTINTLSNGTLAISSTISGTGPLTKIGRGNLFLGGGAHNTYTGGTLVSAGALHLSKVQNFTAAPGTLTLAPTTPGSPITARWYNTGVMTPGGVVTVNANGLIDLNGHHQLLSQVNLNDGGDVQTAGGTLSFTGGGAINVGSLNAPQVGLQASASISGRISAPEEDYLIFNVAPYGSNPLVPDPELVVSAQIAGPESFIAKNGMGTMKLSGNNTFAGSSLVFTEFDINAGTVIAASSTALGGADNEIFLLNGASLALVENITINNKTLNLNSTNPAAIDNRGGHNLWRGPIKLGQDSSMSVNFDWSFTVQGVISGSGALIKRGEGILRFGGNANNTYSGITYVDEGFFFMNMLSGAQAVPGNLIIGRPGGGTVAIARLQGQDPIWGDITVNNGGLLDLDDYDEYCGTLTLNGGGDAQTHSGTLYPIAGVAVNPGSFADQSVISGRLGLFPGTIPFTVGAGSLGAGNADCLISAVIVQSSTTAGLQKNGAGILRLTANNTYTGRTTIDGGTLWIDGSQPQSHVDLDHETRLQGSGTVGDVNLIGSFIAIAPGNSPGTLTCSNIDAFNGSGTLEMELNGHPTGYDQLIARGTVDLRGLDLKASLNFGSAVGQQFTLINNDGSDAVTGTFTGLPQNKKLYVGQELFQISYTGGTGNDVVLTRLITPPPPTLAIERLAPASVRLIWPTNDPAFRLLSNTNLTTTNWIAATPLPTAVSTNHVVTNSVSGMAKFYRLSSP